MNQSTAQLLITPTEFFREKLTHASSTLSVKLGDDLEYYLVQLLCNFISPSKLNPEQDKNSILDTPLVFLLQKAHDAATEEEKLRIFRSLGDVSLYVSGYFQDYFNDKLFDISYYIDMGRHAYSTAAKFSRSRSDQLQVYNQLSDHFNELVDVIAELADSVGADSKQNRDILAIYERWSQSHSTRLLKILQEEGIHPSPTVKTEQ